MSLSFWDIQARRLGELRLWELKDRNDRFLAIRALEKSLAFEYKEEIARAERDQERHRQHDESLREREEKRRAAATESRKKSLAKKRALLRQIMLNRPLDMGGPRDVWLTFTLSVDPRDP